MTALARSGHMGRGSDARYGKKAGEKLVEEEKKGAGKVQKDEIAVIKKVASKHVFWQR